MPKFCDNTAIFILIYNKPPSQFSEGGDWLLFKTGGTLDWTLIQNSRQVELQTTTEEAGSRS